ncbi:hypothetical protein BMI89_05695 [Thioclava sp. F36-7]|nr:hypothetical protein BMI89_05695 [Thioclava sp. F36-7]
MTMLKLTLSTALVTAMGASSALAASAIGLVDDKTLVMFDTDTLEVTGTMDVTGTAKLHGIDLRPSNKTLVAVDADQALYTIDMESGAATKVSQMDTMLPVDGPVIVDFNPKADKLRFMSGTTNHRVNVETGEVTVDGSLAYEEKDMHAGEAPAIAAAAYANSYGMPDSTAMYDVDSTIVALIQQTSPNDGTLAAIGKFGIDMPGEGYAFDIQTTEDMKNTAWLATGNMLYTVDLESGEAMGKGMVEGAGGDIRDLTILPAM